MDYATDEAKPTTGEVLGSTPRGSAIDACEPLQTRGKDMVMEPAGYEKQ